MSVERAAKPERSFETRVLTAAIVDDKEDG